MNETELANEKLKEIESILRRTNRHYLYCKYLNEPDGLDELQVIYKYRILDYARVAFIIVVIIDLCKLYGKGKDEDYSLERLLNILIENHEKINFAIKMSLKELTILKENLNTVKTGALYIRIKELRDKYYAHLDSKKIELRTVMPKFEEFLFLINEAEKITGIINYYLNDSSTMTLMYEIDKADNILRDLLKFKENNK